jgi:hypothetical protein
MPTRYETKHKDFLQRLKDAQANSITLIVISEPQELGDTYEEMVESLNRLAQADLNLAILPPEARE